MSDSDELDLDGGEPSELDGGAKKPSGLASLLPNLLKFVAIGLAAMIFVITVSVITFKILNTSGQTQTIIPENSPYVGERPEYAWYSSIGQVRTQTRDPVAYTVVVVMEIGCDQNDTAAMTELTARLPELKDFVRSFFRSKLAAELQPENESRLKQEIIEILNTRYLTRAKVRRISFSQLDVMET